MALTQSYGHVDHAVTGSQEVQEAIAISSECIKNQCSAFLCSKERSLQRNF